MRNMTSEVKLYFNTEWPICLRINTSVDHLNQSIRTQMVDMDILYINQENAHNLVKDPCVSITKQRESSLAKTTAKQKLSASQKPVPWNNINFSVTIFCILTIQNKSPNYFCSHPPIIMDCCYCIATYQMRLQRNDIDNFLNR